MVLTDIGGVNEGVYQLGNNKTSKDSDKGTRKAIGSNDV